jgi:hypothetical protein
VVDVEAVNGRIMYLEIHRWARDELGPDGFLLARRIRVPDETTNQVARAVQAHG